MKELLKEKRKQIQSKISELRRDRRAAVKHGDSKWVQQIDYEITTLEQKKKFYRLDIHPVQFPNGFVVNGKLIKSYVSKCPRGLIEAIFEEDHLIVSHKDGEIVLKDLSEHYENMELPNGEEFLNSLGIVGEAVRL